MKRNILFLIVLLGLSLTSLNAQHISLGLTVGSGTCWMSNTGYNVVHKESCNIGLTYVYSTNAHWGFAADVKYSREGVKVRYDDDNTTRVSSDFIRIPLRAIYFFNDYGHAVRPKISFGPSFGFLTGGKIRTEDPDGSDILKTNVNDSYRVFDFGLQGSIGANIRLAEDIWLNTDIVYYNGLLTQNKNGSEHMMNRNLVLNLGLTFGLGK